MDLSEIRKRVMAVLGNQLGRDMDEILPDSRLTTDLGCDEFDVTEICLALESEFGIQFTEGDISAIYGDTTVNELAGRVSKYVG